MKFVTAVLLACLPVVCYADDFAVDLDGVRCITSAQVHGQNVLYLASLEGNVACYTDDGQRLWSHAAKEPAVMFEIQAVDLDGDQTQELLTASGDGHITCWNADGSTRWRFHPDHKVRFSEIAVIGSGTKASIFAGGNDRKLYKLDASGQLIQSVAVEGVIRTIAAGDFTEPGKPSLFVMTYAHDKFNWKFFGFVDPETLKTEKQLGIKSIASHGWNAKEWSSLMVTDFSVRQIGDNKLDSLVFFGDGLKCGPTCRIINGQFQETLRLAPRQSKAGSADKQRYAHVHGTLLSPSKDEILLRYGSVAYRFDLTGELLERVGGPKEGFPVNAIHFDSNTGRVYYAGAVSGGNGVYVHDVNDPDWLSKPHPPIGQFKQVQDNLAALYQQVLNFTPPAYQERAEKPWVIISGGGVDPQVKSLDFNPIQFVDQHTWTENFDREELVEVIGEEANKRDRRKAYDLSQEQIVAMAVEQEKKKAPFTLWAGHGTDPYFLEIETLEKIVEAAPTTCHGFIYAEMHNADAPTNKYWLENYLPRIAKACRKSGIAKLYFRYKNVFWIYNVQKPGWKDLFLSGDYRDIVIPAAEDTSSRTQDLNFVGRVGMLMSGCIDNYAIRLIDDNPTSWRPLTPGAQRSASPYVRNGVLGAAYGSRYGIHFGGHLDGAGLNLLYAILASGVMPQVQRDDIASIGSLHLMRKPDDELFHTIDTHHNIDQYSDDDENAVLSQAQMHWAGANLPEHDFSRAALGVKYRWTNFLPELPHGMVPIVPADYAASLRDQGLPYTESDGKRGFIKGQPVAAADFGKTIRSVAKMGARRLPVTVTGASWAAVRVDPLHLRVILLDPDYLTPRKHRAAIQFNGTKPQAAKDILTDEALAFDGNSLSIEVPAGSMRFIDLDFSGESDQ